MEQLLQEQRVSVEDRTGVPLRDRLARGEVRSAYEVVDRGLVWLALVWQALWLIGDPRLWPNRQTSALAGVLLGVVGITWLVLLLVQAGDLRRWRTASRVANVSALFAAAVAVLVESSQSAATGYEAASSLAVLPGSQAGLLFALPAAIAWLTAMVAAEAIIILGVFSATASSHVESVDVLYPAYALATGVVMLAARHALVRDARRVDDAALALMEAEERRLTAEGGQAVVRREERILHETVLNTLNAIVRGGLDSAALRERLRERCRESADVLRSISGSVPVVASSRSLASDIDDLCAELEAMGVVVDVQADDLTGIPPHVYQAIRTATREALTNVARHAAARQVSVTAQRTRRGEEQSIRVEIRDDGRGFDPAGESTRFGVQGAVVAALADVGGRARIESQPGQGTRVIVEWDGSGPRAASIPLARPDAAFVIPLVLSWVTFITMVVVLTRGHAQDPSANALAYGLFLFLCLLTAITTLRAPLPGWVVLVVVAVGPLIYQLQGMAMVGATEPWADWASAAIIAMFVLAAGAGPEWAWPLVLVTWLLIQGDVLHELLAAGTALIIAAALFGRSTRRNARALELARARAAEQQAAQISAMAGVGQIRARYGQLRELPVVGLLDDLAAGRVEPEDPNVKEQAALAERYIRTLIRVDRQIDPVHDLAVDLAGRALRRGVNLDVSLADEPRWLGRADESGFASLTLAVDHAIRGSAARLTARWEAGIYVVRLIVAIAESDQEAMSGLPLPGVLLEPSEPDMLWELRLSNGGGNE